MTGLLSKVVAADLEIVDVRRAASLASIGGPCTSRRGLSAATAEAEEAG